MAFTNIPILASYEYLQIVTVICECALSYLATTGWSFTNNHGSFPCMHGYYKCTAIAYMILRMDKSICMRQNCQSIDITNLIVQVIMIISIQ